MIDCRQQTPEREVAFIDFTMRAVGEIVRKLKRQDAKGSREDERRTVVIITEAVSLEDAKRLQGSPGLPVFWRETNG